MTKRSDCRWDDRPDGADAALYKMEGWSKRRVAWEFLRRSKRYQRACNEIFEAQRGDLADASPSEYGYRIPLKRMIDYSCDWSEAKDSLEFVTRTSVLVQHAKGNDCDEEEKLIFQIDLDAIRRNRAVLNLRLREIKQQCEKKLGTYATPCQKNPASRRFRAEPMARSLRYLDLSATGRSSRLIGNLLYGSAQSTEYRSRMLDKDRKRAKGMLKNGLRDLIVSVLLDPNGVVSYPVAPASDLDD